MDILARCELKKALQLCVNIQCVKTESNLECIQSGTEVFQEVFADLKSENFCEQNLRQMRIPHDDQHGDAVATKAASVFSA